MKRCAPALSQWVPASCRNPSRWVRSSAWYAPRSISRDSSRASNSLNRTRLLGLQLDLAERRFILRDVLVEHVGERFRLLRAQIQPFEVMNRHRVGRRLIHRSKQKEEIPQA